MTLYLHPYAVAIGRAWLARRCWRGWRALRMLGHDTCGLHTPLTGRRP